VTDQNDFAAHDTADSTPVAEPLLDDLKERSVRGGIWSVGSNVTQTIVRMAALLVLARLLDPEAYGLIGMAAIATGFLGLFSDLGLTSAIVQRKKVTDAELSALFWIGVAASVFLVAIAAILAPLLAAFYDDNRLTALVIVLAAAFPLRALGVPHQALLQRAMRFGAVGAAGITGTVVGSAVAVAAATAGAGYWALVAVPLVGAFVTTALSWAFVRWVPGRPRPTHGMRELLSFGAHLTGFNVVNYGVRNTDDLLIGWRWGASPLGIYANAYRLLTLPLGLINTPVSAVAVSGLSRLQDDDDAFAAYYLRALNLVAWATMPLAAVFIVSSDEIVRTLLGGQWTEAGRVFLYLSPVLFVSPMRNTAGWIFLGRGRTDRMLRWALMSAPIPIGAFFIGLPHGPEGVALAFTISAFLLTLPNLIYATTGTPLSLGHILRVVRAPALAAGVGMGSAWLVMNVLDSVPAPGFVALTAVIVAAAAAITIWRSGEWTALQDAARQLATSRSGP
jgi:PST family polysaccharide transporter